MVEKKIIQDGDVFTCIIDGDIVEGVVGIHPKEICVKLLKDDMDLSASGKLMLMAPMIYTTEIGTQVANDYCMTRLRELMEGLYHDYQVILNNREEIRNLLPVFLSTKDECNCVIADLNTQKRSIKKDFLEGRLSQKSYMKQLNDLKDQIYNQQQAINEAFFKIFSPILSECLHCDNIIGAIETLS